MKCEIAIALQLCLAAFCASADVKYPVTTMDISNEAGPKSATLGSVCIARRTHWASLSVTTPSRVTIPLGEGATHLDAIAGVDCNTKVDSAAVFRVLAPDGRVLWREGDVRKGKEHKFSLDIDGLDAVILEVAGEPGILAGWAEPEFSYRDGKYPPEDVRNHSPQFGVLTPPESAAPRINGPAVYGVRPGHPIIYHVPVTGERPVKVKLDGLDALDGLEHLVFDAEKQILSGSIEKPGEYTLTIVAENAKGHAKRDFTIKVGDKILLTPAMGWSSWNCFSWDVTDAKIREAADALVSSGLAEHGYSYVNIDDFWQNKPESRNKDLQGPERAADGTINSNARFPDMKDLADYIHSKGLKAGIYSSPGPKTCGGCTGSWRHEAQDAKTFADWGYDYLKYDWCSYSRVADGEGLERAMKPYRIMGRALREQRRDIVFSLCQYGKDDVAVWGTKVEGQSWRTTGDVFDRWTVVMNGIKTLKGVWQYAAPGGWNDPDMLCIGRMVWSGFKESRLAPNEQYTHVSIWALAAAPLLIGCDLTKLDEFTLSLLRNDEVIAIDQDPLGAAAACIVDNGGYEIWARPLADGSIAAGLFNKMKLPLEISFDMIAAGMEGEWKVRDCWRQKDEGVAKGVYKSKVYGHATHLVRFIPGKGSKLSVRDIREGRNLFRPEGGGRIRQIAFGDGCEGCDEKKKEAR